MELPLVDFSRLAAVDTTIAATLHDTSRAMKNRRAGIPFIFLTVMLDMVALGLIAPVLPNLILSFVNNDMTRTAIWNGVFLTVFAAMQFFCSPVIGVLSDRFGRRPVLLLSTLGLGLDYIVMALDRKSTRLNSSHE